MRHFYVNCPNIHFNACNVLSIFLTILKYFIWK